jgi:hypothetical protein
MKKLLFASALVLTACADDPVPDLDQPVTDAVVDASATSVDATERALTASFVTTPAACDSAEVSFEATTAYSDGTPVASPVCHYDFGDGTSGDSCSAVHSYATGPGDSLTNANVTLTVTDAATGATATFTDVVLPPGNFDASLNASSDGLTISWEKHAFYVDGEIGVGPISIEPAQNVIVDDPSVLQQGTGTVRVTEPGTYVVRAHAAIFPGVQNCEADLEQTVEVTACSTMH